MERAKFCIEGLEGEYIGYTGGKKWNGWECPMFEESEGMRLLETIKKCDDSANDKFENGTFWFTIGDNDAQEGFPSMEINFEDTTLVVYPIGAGCWCWDMVDEVGDATDFFENELDINVTVDGDNFVLDGDTSLTKQEFIAEAARLKAKIKADEADDSYCKEHDC